MNRWCASFGFVLLGAGAPAAAHHSYAMFDKTKSVVVEGSVAKVEWINPHSFVWIYVEKKSSPGEYDLFGFENASANQLTLNGWKRGMVKTGEQVSVRYFPLRNGSPGGYLIWLDRADGSRLTGDENAFGVAAELQRLEKEAGSRAAPQPGILAASSAARSSSDSTALPDFRGWWIWDYTATNDSPAVALPAPFPFKPEVQVRVEQSSLEIGGLFVRAVASDASYEDGARLTALLGQTYCLPPRFIGAQAGEGAVEFLFTPGRITILDETGLVRRVMLDQALPAEPTESNAGTSVGHWEGKTLVVETSGFDGEAQVSLERLGKGARSVERISLKEPDVLEIALSLSAPDIFSAPYEHTYVFRRDPDHQFADASHCKSNDRSVDPVTRQDRFDLTPPPDLPPPPSE